ncbi:MAG TPA: hypothetical protein VFH68_26370 [Polyangia bacterium]|nr:hypothetical protein [Polyangia bacterium]
MPDRVLRSARFFVIAALLGGGAARAATATAAGASEPAGTDRLFVGTSACPAPAAVRAEVETLVPHDRLNARLRAAGAASGSGAPVEIIDLGLPFRIVAAGKAREYRDEARDCAHRARIAAVFVVLVIDPAAMLRAPAATPPPPPPPAPAAPEIVIAAPMPTPPSGGFTRARVRVALGAAVEAGVGADASFAQLGAALRLEVGRGRLVLALGAAALAPIDAAVGGVRVRHARYPGDVSVQARGTVVIGARRVLQPYAELGAALALVQESALELATPQQSTAVELGARGAAGVTLAGSSRLALFLALHAEWVPGPPAISALPRGVVGHTPTLWLGAVTGAVWGWP